MRVIQYIKRVAAVFTGLCIILSIVSCRILPSTVELTDGKEFSYSMVPEFDSEPYAVINSNIPFFSTEDLTTECFEYYSELDALGRCGSVWACLGKDLLPTEKRGNISGVKPTGWQISKYDFVDGKYLYNRCHLIAYSLTGENANINNLITGTRYMNTEGMLPFENMLLDYVRETDTHVMYRVTPIFIGAELLARGVLMEGYSVEDKGEDICFCVFAYNVQPNVTISYINGDNYENDKKNNTIGTEIAEYILNTNTKKYHLPSCDSAKEIKENNKSTFSGDASSLTEMGYSPCGICKP